MSRFLFILLPAVFLIFTSSAQNGRISGTIVDSKTGETLPGAQVVVEGTAKGASADFDGKFAINNVTAGKVTLVVSYISYTTKKIPGVNVVSGDVTNVNIQLDPSTSQDLTEVEVVVTLNKENNTALVLQQKNNASVSDGISAETIKRTPDRNTSDVLRRVSGASIQDNKFAIVRGLNDRYNSAYLNGAPLPSTESDRKAFSFDIFPANMLDNLVITKTARPDLPGEFGGGIIEINTKNIPDKNFVSVSAGTGYNTITTFKEKLGYKGGKTDWIGVDDGTRALPAGLPAYGDYPADNVEQARYAKETGIRDWGIYKSRFAPNSSYQLSTGWNFKRKERDFFGVMASLSYNNTNTFFTTDRISYQTGSPNDTKNPLVTDKTYSDKTFQNQKLAGALLNLSCKLNDNNSLSFKNMYSIFTDNRTIERRGLATPNESNPLMVKATALWFTQNNALTSQLIGDHYLPKTKIKLHWNLNYANVKRTIPDLRRHTYTRLTYLENKSSDPSEPPIYDPTDTIYKAEITLANASGNEYSGASMWSSLNEYIYNAAFDATHNYKLNPKWNLESKAGLYYQERARTFDFRQFVYSKLGGFGSTTTFNNTLTLLPEDKIFAAENMGIMIPGNGSGPAIGGFKLVENTLAKSSYSAGSSLAAGFAMATLRYKEFVRIITGLRFESYNQRLSYPDDKYVVNKQILSQDTTVNDLLPSLNIIYSPNDKTNLRTSYSRTLNRPEFRELAPFLFYDFNTQFSLNGDPSLKRALIDNYDVRYEWFPGAGQLVSVSAFHKQFTNPIELSKSQNPSQIEYKNIASAFAQGLELEYRVVLGRFHKKDSTLFGKILDRLTLFTNASLIRSKVDNSKLAQQGSSYARPMQGQSPYLLNGGLSYLDTKHDFNFSLMVNRVGQRIYIVGNDVFQEVWEMPRTVLDFQVGKGFFKNRLEMRLTIKDLLAKSQPVRFIQNFDASRVRYNSDNTASFWRQQLGTTFSFQVSYKF